MSYAELAGSPLVEYRRSSSPTQIFRHVKKVICDWAERDTVGAQLWAATVEGFPCRHLQIMPYTDGRAEQPITSDGNYEKALLVAEYGPLDHEETSNYYTFHERLRFVYISVPREVIQYFDASGKPVIGEVPQSDEWPFLRYEFSASGPSAPVCPPLGAVNSGPFSTARLGLVWPAGTVRYLGVELETTFHLGGSTRYNYVHSFLVHSDHWDKFWIGGQWQYLYDLSGHKIERYPKAPLVFY